MQKNLEISPCGCPESKSPQKSTKYYQEIGAEVIGNQLLIRVEKDKTKLKKKLSEWSPPCNCGLIPEIKRPIRTQPPRIVNIDEDNQIIFRIDSKFQIKSENPNYQPEISTYQLGDSSQGDQQRTLMILPQLEGSGPQEVYRDHVTIGNQNIYMMRIKKKPSAKEQKNRNIELEVTYPNLPPRIPTPPPTPPPSAPTLPPPPPPPPVALPEIDVSKSLVESKKVDETKKGKKELQFTSIQRVDFSTEIQESSSSSSHGPAKDDHSRIKIVSLRPLLNEISIALSLYYAPLCVPFITCMNEMRMLMDIALPCCVNDPAEKDIHIRGLLQLFALIRKSLEAVVESHHSNDYPCH